MNPTFKKSNYLWLLDAGHGGIDISGKYTTAPNKMFIHPPKGKEEGFTFYEGEFNRKVVKGLSIKLSSCGIDYKLVMDNIRDTPLAQRVSTADFYYKKDKRAVYVSIHSNAGGGKGAEVYTSRGQTKSDILAQYFCQSYREVLPNVALRSDQIDGDADKEADFFVLRKTDCPAILTESLFYDNRAEAKFLLSVEGLNKIIDVHFKAILNIEKSKPI